MKRHQVRTRLLGDTVDHVGVEPRPSRHDEMRIGGVASMLDKQVADPLQSLQGTPGSRAPRCLGLAEADDSWRRGPAALTTCKSHDIGQVTRNVQPLVRGLA